MTFGSSPVRQQSWDARAAANFMCGGAGAGLIVFAALSGERGQALTILMLAGVAWVGAGLLCVWHEIGRPLRALHVFFHPRTSWMSREAFVAALLMPAGIVAAARLPGFTWVAAALALAFIVCQARMLQASRGIPAWRTPLVVPLLLASGLAEGAGLFLAAAPWLRVGSQSLLALFGALVLSRMVVWLAFRRALAGVGVPPALAALDRAGRVLQLAGTLLPVVSIALIASGVVSGTATLAAAAAAGVLAAASGAHMKYTLIVHAGFMQGFALARLPVRGTRR
jgi:phenylacetyl-CoA:acceptor oxidoreductase 26-kDa subunit